MTSERQRHRRAVRNWEKQITRADQGLEDSKTSAGDFAGDRPAFQPSQEYLGRIEDHVFNIESRLVRATELNISERKRARMEAQLHQLRVILLSQILGVRKAH